MSLSADGMAPHRSNLDVQAGVLRALVLRDMKTRFGGFSMWGYLILVLWPVVHVMVLVAIMAFRGLPSPLGDSALVFAATGALPVLMANYTSSETMKAIVQNKPLLYYPQVKIYDLMIARFIVEIVKNFTGLIVIVAILVAAGADPRPPDPFTSVCGYLAGMLLGIGMGAINIGIVSFFPGWMMGSIALRILLYLSAGVFFLPNMLPDQLYSIMKWNPLTQVVEWVRIGYYPELSVEVDYSYVMLVAATCLTIGLLMERTVVRRLS